MARKEQRKDQRKDQDPLVVTYADHEVITPPNPLRKAVAPAGPDDDDPVARAEAALAQLSSEFSSWMLAECERLETAREHPAVIGNQHRREWIRITRRPPDLLTDSRRYR